MASWKDDLGTAVMDDCRTDLYAASRKCDIHIVVVNLKDSSRLLDEDMVNQNNDVEWSVLVALLTLTI